MWIVEVNFAGRRFTYRVPDNRRPIVRFGSRGFGWLSSQPRPTRTA
ncbi:hypothetical protein [Mycolicibacterium sp. XJ879]